MQNHRKTFFQSNKRVNDFYCLLFSYNCLPNDHHYLNFQSSLNLTLTSSILVRVWWWMPSLLHVWQISALLSLYAYNPITPNSTLWQLYKSSKKNGESRANPLCYSSAAALLSLCLTPQTETTTERVTEDAMEEREWYTDITWKKLKKY